jgi:hypothetical protein
MEKNKKERLLKQILQAERRITELQKEAFKKPRVPLEKKIFAGHWRFFAVRADILRSSIGQQIEKIVQACNTFRLGKKKDPDSFRGTTEIVLPNPPNHSTLFSQNQGLHPISQQELDKLELSNTQKKKWFLEVTRTLKAGSKNIHIPRYFPQIPPHMLEFAYKPAYITEITIPDGDKESELIKLYQFMEKVNGWQKLHGNSKDEWDLNLSKKRKIEKTLQKEIVEELTEL